MKSLATHRDFSKVKVGETLFSALHNAVVAIDVHEVKMVACYQACKVGDPHITIEHFESGTTKTEISRLVSWILKKEPELVIFESTGVYWMSLYDELESRGFKSTQIAVLNARDVKAVRGRKTDWSDASRLAELGRSGNYRPSFIQEKRLRQLKVLSRNLFTLRKECQAYKNRLHKLLTAVGMRASQVFSNIRGVTATKIIDAVLNGTTDKELYSFIKRTSSRLKASPDEIYEALKNDSNSKVWFSIQQTKEILTYHESKYNELLSHLRRLSEPYESFLNKIKSIPGFKEISALTILCEIGPDLSKFRSIKNFTSWMGICPGNTESAGKQYSGRCSKGNKYLKTLLVEVANGIGISKKGYLYEVFQKYKERRGHRRAIIALAHKLARIIYTLIKQDTTYTEDENSGILKEHRIDRFNFVAQNLRDVNLEIATDIIIRNVKTKAVESVVQAKPKISSTDFSIDDISADG